MLNDLEELSLFGCINLSFPPHQVAVRANVATQTGMSVAGVRAIQNYIADPTSWLSFNLDHAKKMMKMIDNNIASKIMITVPYFRKAGGRIRIRIRIINI